VRVGNDVNADQFADAPGCRGARIGGRFDRAHVAAHGDHHQTGAHEFLAGQHHIGRLDHGIGSFNGGDQPLGFDHAECFHYILQTSVNSLT